MFPLTIFLAVLHAAASPTHHHPCVVDGAATASCFGFDPNDATDILQGALDLPSLRRLTIDYPPVPHAGAVSTPKTPTAHNDAAVRWIVRPLTITRSNVVVVLQENVVLMAKRDEYHGNTDSLLTLDKVDNVSLIGQTGSRLEMRRADYAVPSWVSMLCNIYVKFRSG